MSELPRIRIEIDENSNYLSRLGIIDFSADANVHIELSDSQIIEMTYAEFLKRLGFEV